MSEDIAPAEVSEKKFDIVRRGYDPAAVRAFLERLRLALEAYAAREKGLVDQLAEAERRAANPELDMEMLTKALGQEVVQVLGSAQDAAKAVMAKAGDEAATVVEHAHAEAERLTAKASSVLAERSEEAERAAQARMAEVEAQARQILDAGRAEVEAFLEHARAQVAAQAEEGREQAAALLEASRIEGAEMIAEARQLRARVLTDLAKRRRVLHLQVERLRAGRESLTEVVRSSKVAFEALDEGLARAEADARLAAEAAVRQLDAVPEADAVAELEAALVMGRQAELVGPRAASRRRPRPLRSSPPGPAEPALPEPGSAEPAEPDISDLGEVNVSESPELPIEPALLPDLAGPADADPEQPEPVDVVSPPEPVPAEPAITVEPAPSAIEPADIEPADIEPADIEPADIEPADIEPADIEPADIEPAAAQPVGPASADTGPAVDEAADIGPAEVDEAAVAEPAAEPRASAQPSTTGAASSGQPVENLFARLRAAGAGPQEHGSTEQFSPEGLGAANPGAANLGADNLGAANLGADKTTAGLAPVLVESALQRRDVTVERLVGGLARKLKRALQDDQNAMLDQLRVRSGRSSGPDAGSVVLGAMEAHRENFCHASRPLLTEAALAGAELAGAEADGAVLGGEGASAAVEQSGQLEAEQLASALSGALQRRLSQVLGEAEAADEARTAELIGVAYREWKGERIEGLAGDHVVAAFGRGYLAATPASATLIWVVDDGGGHCPDCDDNALAGPQPPGAIYPTGQAHPPAHPGCRCLLVPS